MKKCIGVLYFLLIGGVFAFAQQRANTLYAAIQLAQGKIEEGLEYNKKVVVYDFRVILQEQDQKRPTNQLSDYVLEQLVAALTSGNRLDVPSRSDVMLAARQREINFETSGEVSDDDIVAIGNAMGADVVISGTLRAFSKYYEFNLMVTDMKTLRNILPIMIRLNKNDDQTKDLLGILAEEKEQARLARETWLSEQEKRDFRLVIGAQAGASIMFSNHAGDTLYSNSGDFTYEDKGATAFTGQFDIGLNNVKENGLGFRLNGVFSANDGLTTTWTNKEDASSGKALEFSYSTVDIAFLLETAPSRGAVLFLLYAGPYISIPVGEPEISIDGIKLTTAKLEPFLGPIGNFGAAVGLTFGYKVGLTGYIVLDARYKYDFLSTKFSAAGYPAYKEATEFYHRQGLQLTLGYEFWI